jgi:hypothetical protein
MDKTLLAGAAALALLAAGSAFATTITFEGGTPGAPISTDYLALGATFSNADYAQCGGGCPAPVNGIFASDPTFHGLFDVGFVNLQSSVSFINVSFSDVVASAYDTFGNLISTLEDTQGFPITGAVDTLSGPGISYVQFSWGGGASGYGIDDLTFSGAPEPAVWTMLLLGFAGLGGALRQSRQKDLALAS